MSELIDHPSLAHALRAFQAELPHVPKASTATVPTKSGGSYSYTYADLADISRIVLPLITRHGLAFTAGPDVRDGASVLAWSLLHVSGDERSGAYLMPTGMRTPQEIGSQITYARRYALVSALGLAPEDDDDGARAEAVAREQRQTRAVPGGERSGLRGRADQAPERGAPTQAAPPKMITDAQIRKLHTGFGDIGLTDRDDKLAYANGVLEANAIGRVVASSTELTMQEAKLVIDSLERDAAPPSHREPQDGEPRG